MVQKYEKCQYHATFVGEIYMKVIKRRFKWLGEALRLVEAYQEIPLPSLGV